MRHDKIPPFARVHGRNHPSVKAALRRERREVIGHIDSNGKYVSHKHQQAPGEETTTSNSRLLDLLAALSSITIIVLLGWSLGMWIAS